MQKLRRKYPIRVESAEGTLTLEMEFTTTVQWKNPRIICGYCKYTLENHAGIHTSNGSL